MTAAVCERTSISVMSSEVETSQSLNQETPRLRSASHGMTILASARVQRLGFVLPEDDWMKISCVACTSNQRTRGDVEKTFSIRHVAEIVELIAPDVFNDGRMIRTDT